MDEGIVLKEISINGEKYPPNRGVYYFRGDMPKIEVLAYSIGNTNKLGLKELDLYVDDQKVYSVVFDEISWSDFNDVWKVYGEDSVMSEYSFAPWYVLYPKGNSSLVKLNRFDELKPFPNDCEVKIELVDVWGMRKTLKFRLRKVGR